MNKCSKCGTCCKLFWVNLNSEEYRSGRYKTMFEEFGIVDDFSEAEMEAANIISQNEDGSCIYLKDGRCSIHTDRPQVCKKFFCNSKEKQYQGMIKKIKEQNERA